MSLAEINKASGIKSKSPAYEARGIKSGERKNRRKKTEIEVIKKAIF
jgi:hypothetical protein